MDDATRAAYEILQRLDDADRRHLLEEQQREPVDELTAACRWIDSLEVPPKPEPPKPEPQRPTHYQQASIARTLAGVQHELEQLRQHINSEFKPRWPGRYVAKDDDKDIHRRVIDLPIWPWRGDAE